MSWISASADGVILLLHVQPNAPRSALVGLHGGRLKVRIAAPPVEGAANEEIVRFFAFVLEVRRAQVSILSGESGRQKRLLISGVTADVVRSKIDALILRDPK